jgi:predicted phosphodiesterase
MKIQYMSDLHFEFRENSRHIKHNRFPVTGDILVLAGDIFYLKDRVAPLGNFWEWASKNYRQVLLVPGNHEYYNYCDVMERGLQWRWMFKENVGYYQNQVLRIDDTDFIMNTFWSHIEPADEYFVWKGLNDFRQTMYKGKLLQTEAYNQMHDFCLGHIKKSLAESTAKHIVVVTHYLPTLQVVAPQHKGSVLNSAFATEYEELIADSRIDAWIYGHSHTNIDTEIGNTKVICNQMGYIFENEHVINGFDPGKFLTIENE